MGIPIVLMVGTEHLAVVPDYLMLRSVVVIAPTTELLRRWQEEATAERPPSGRATEGLRVDVAGRRLMWGASALPLTDLEFQVAARLVAEPGRAWSFRELREAGWAPGRALDVDVFAVRSVIQRIRGKLRAAGTGAQVASVRGYGFRLEVS
jgi:two-component system, OmpR family, response regulator